MGSSKSGLLGSIIEAATSVISMIFPGAGALISGLLGNSRTQEAQEDNALRLNEKSTQRMLPLVYGTRLVGTNDVFIELAEEDNKAYIWIVSALAEGQCAGIVTIPGPREIKNGEDEVVLRVSNIPVLYIDEKIVYDFNDLNRDYNEYKDTPVPGTIPTVNWASQWGTDGGRIGDVVKWWFKDGRETQTVEPHIDQAFPHYDDNLKGICYIVYKIEWREGLFFSVPARTITLIGKTNNPAYALKDYISNNVYGLNMANQIDTQSFDEAAQYCTNVGWRLNYAITTRRKAQDIIDTILYHFRGKLIWYSGKLYLKYSDTRYEVVVGSIGDHEIARGGDGKAMISVSQPGTIDIPNGYCIKYVNPGKNWTVDDIYIGDQNDKTSVVNFLGFIDRGMAIGMAKYLLSRAKNSRVTSVTLRPNTVKYDVHDLINFTSSELESEPGPYRIIETNISNGGIILITLINESDINYTNPESWDNGTLDDVYLPSPYDIPPSIEDINVNEIFQTVDKRTETQAHLSWATQSHTIQGIYPFMGKVEIWVSYDQVEEAKDVTNWLYQGVSYEGNITLARPREGLWIWFRYLAKSSTGLAGFQSSFQYQRYYLVGRTETPPPEVAKFLVSVATLSVSFISELENTDIESGKKVPDIDGYEIRLGNAWHRNSWLDALIFNLSKFSTVTTAGLKSTTDWRAFSRSLGTNGLYGGFAAQADVDTGVFIPDGITNKVEVYNVSYSLCSLNNIQIFNFSTYGPCAKRASDSSLSGKLTSPVFDTNLLVFDPKRVYYLVVHFGYCLGEFTAESTPSSVEISILQSDNLLTWDKKQSNLQFYAGRIYKRYLKLEMTITDGEVGSKFYVGPMAITAKRTIIIEGIKAQERMRERSYIDFARIHVEQPPPPPDE